MRLRNSFDHIVNATQGTTRDLSTELRVLDGLAERTLGMQSMAKFFGRVGEVSSLLELTDFARNAGNAGGKTPIPLGFDGGLSGLIAQNQVNKMELSFFNVSLQQGYSSLSRYFSANSYKYLGVNYGFTNAENAATFISDGVVISDAIRKGQLMLYQNFPPPSTLSNNNLTHMIIYNSDSKNKASKEFICVPVE